MTNFEKITASPDVLGEFLASLPVATGPWDEEFHRAFCDSCEVPECGMETCPHKGNRQLWWLTMGDKADEEKNLVVIDYDQDMENVILSQLPARDIQAGTQTAWKPLRFQNGRLQQG